MMSPRLYHRTFGPATLRALWVLVFIACVFLSPSSFAQGPSGHRPIHINEELPTVNLGDYAAMLVDSAGTLSLEDVKRAYNQGKFTKTESDLEFGFTKDTIWIRAQVENLGDKDALYILDNSYPFIDSLTFHELDRQGTLVRERVLGDKRPFYDRDILVRSLAYQLLVPAQDARTVYIRVQTTGSMSVPLKAYRYTDFGQHLHQSSLVLGVFYGLIFGLSLYHLVLWHLARDSDHLLFALLGLSNLGCSVAMDGVSFMLLPDLIGWQQITPLVWLCTSAALGLSFSDSFLDVAHYFPRIHKLIWGLKIFFFASAVALVGSQSASLFPIVLLVTLGSLVVVVGVAVARIAQGYAPARTYLIAWSVMLFSVFFGILSSLKVIGSYSLTPYFQKIGITLEMFLLAVAMANKIKLLRSQNDRAVQAANRAHAQNVAKSEFLAKMSHEIRTPMNGVLGMAEILRGTQLDDSQANCARIIQTSGQALLDVINDILDYSKIEAGKMMLEQRFFDLEKLLDDLESIFFNVSKEKGIPLIIHLDPKIVLRIKGDETRLRQVLINLVSNAYKFTSQGAISVCVGPDPSLDNSLLFSVKDTGVGIGKSAQDHLFESFSQEDSTITREYGGTGLGLAICAQLVSLMGGSIELRSEKGQGSEFFFSLPMQFDPNARSLAELTKKRRPPGSNAKVLVVSKPDQSAQHLREVLRTWGLDCEAKDPLHDPLSGEELSTFDLLIVHENVAPCELGELLDLTSTLPGSHPSVLVCTPTNLSTKLEGQHSTRRVKSLIQPSGRKLMRAAIFELLDSPAPAASRKPGLERPRAELDYSALKVLVAEDNKVNQAVVKGMLKRFSIVPTVVNNGQEAVQAYDDASTPFNLIFMDCEMPELDGYQATMKIRERPSRSEHPVLIFALTAHALSEYRDKALQAGMDDHLTKPLSIDALRKALADASSKFRDAA